MEVEEEDWDVKGEKRAAATPYPSGAGCGRRASRGRGGQCQRRMHPHGMWGVSRHGLCLKRHPEKRLLHGITTSFPQRASEPRSPGITWLMSSRPARQFPIFAHVSDVCGKLAGPKPAALGEGDEGSVILVKPRARGS